MSDLRYPIGRFQHEGETTPEQREQWMRELAEAPAQLRWTVSGLSEAQLDTPYREEGWTVRQVVHHLADSHLMAYARCRLTLTESEPTVSGYSQTLWADLPDSRTGDVEPSLRLLEGLHARWLQLLRAMTPDDFQRRYIRSDGQVQTLDRVLGVYSFHARHHVAQIQGLRQRMGWN